MIKILGMGLFSFVMFFEANANSCDDPSNHDQKVHDQQVQLTKEADSQIGMPGITRFTEKKLLRQLYELRDKNISTYSYVPDMQGRLWHVCDSIGYGLPYGAQFSNPDYIAYASGNVGVATLPQPEPNGLYMPPTAEGTWIMCSTDNGDIKPMYVEPRVIVSPFPMNSAGDWQKKTEKKGKGSGE